MPIAGDLEAFLQEHRRCGDLRSGIHEALDPDPIIWMDCSCGGYIAKLVTHPLDSRDRKGGPS